MDDAEDADDANPVPCVALLLGGGIVDGFNDDVRLLEVVLVVDDDDDFKLLLRIPVDFFLLDFFEAPLPGRLLLLLLLLLFMLLLLLILFPGPM